MMIFIASCQKTPTTPDTVPISLQNFTEWLNAIKVTDFTAQTVNNSLTLTSEKEMTAETALTSIKTALSALSKENIVINNIDSLTWQEEVTSDKEGIIKVSVSPAEGMKFADDLTASLANNEFTITVKPLVSEEDISIDGPGKSADMPLDISLYTGTDYAKEAPFTIKTGTGVFIHDITHSPLKWVVGIQDIWNVSNLEIFKPYISKYDTALYIDYLETFKILEDVNIKLKTSQIYKLTLTISYSKDNNTLTKNIDLYVNLKKDHQIVNDKAIIKAFIEGISGQTYTGSEETINIMINDNVTFNMVGLLPYLAESSSVNKLKFFDVSYGKKGSISYINSIATGLNRQDVIQRLKTKLLEIGINWSGSSFNFYIAESVFAISAIEPMTVSDSSFVFRTSSYSAIDITKGIDITLMIPEGWVE
ncbi:hypothetical protein Bint_2201 [Brachyspira intermedia PWS/A]|uniref:Uncharacterized protein n=2 Tax=Brachyspira intermedia TaxID=84377 RepID=G0ELW0_BRAIP|nr:hypothetical protein Bint_2201 [Brachyspira intermedia PWS/A]